MAAKYHISENGMPGKCEAASSDSCPKTQAGDSFHGDLEEASQESQRRFEDQLGAFVTASKVEEKAETPSTDASKSKGYTVARFKNYTAAELRAELAVWSVENPADDSTDLEMAIIAAEEREAAQPAGEVYVHPQGKTIRVDADGTVRAYKDGREVSTSATVEKLRNSYGAWKREAPKFARTVDAKTLKGSYDSSVEKSKQARSELETLVASHREYDKRFAEAEGRAHYIDYSEGYANIREVRGVNPKGHTSYDPIPAHAAAERKAFADWKSAVAEREAAQTALEEAGHGDKIPDDGNTIRVRTQAQKWLLKDELLGQISDGKWENASNNPWQYWSNSKVVVDPKNPGRNFSTRKDNYNLSAPDLLDVVGDRMQENVRSKTGKRDYNETEMRKDLKDLKSIFKTARKQVSGN